MIKVVSFTICPFVQRVTALLEAKQIPYRVEFIGLSNKPRWFLDISPTGQVPVLVTESGDVLFESDAIVEYLDEVYEPLEPSITPAQRAQDRAWSYQASKHYLVQCSAQRSADRDTLLARADKLGEAFDKAEKALGDGPYFKGASLSNVDIAWLPLLHRAHIIQRHTCYDFLEKYPKVKAWQSALIKTGLAEKSVPQGFEDAFKAFYLSDKTYLGAGQGAGGDCPPSAANACCGTYACC